MTAPDPLDELLSRAPYHPDDGFTEAVLARLPARRRDGRALVLGLSWLAAATLGALGLPGLLGALQAASLPETGLSPSLLVAGLCTAGALGYAAARLLGNRV